MVGVAPTNMDTPKRPNEKIKKSIDKWYKRIIANFCRLKHWQKNLMYLEGTLCNCIFCICKRSGTLKIEMLSSVGISFLVFFPHP
jgi:hypothetical protein